MNTHAPSILAPHIDAYQPVPIELECVSYFQIPHFKIIGLPNTEVGEARERVRAAFHASEFDFPRRNVVVNLSPADLPKSGLGLDLAIALAILNHRWSENQRTVVTPPDSTHTLAAWGGLALDGSIRPCGNVPRVVEALRHRPPAILLLHPDDAHTMKRLFLGFPSLPGFHELCAVMLPVQHLREVPDRISNFRRLCNHPVSDRSELMSNESAKSSSMPSQLLDLPRPLLRALLASVAGKHHLLLIGPQGAGKSYALKWLAMLLPTPSLQTQWNTHVHMGTLPEHASTWIREVSPDVSTAALLGSVGGSVGNQNVRIGELALADEGVVIADEFAEWNRDSRESLRTPLDQGQWTLARARRTVRFSSRFIFAATANYCPCGGVPRDRREQNSRDARSTHESCTCSLSVLRAYRRRLSGPILDRIDATVDVRIATAASERVQLSECQSQVQRARERLQDQWGSLPGNWSPEATEKNSLTMKMQPDLDQWLRRASLRTRHKCIRLAATFAALDELEVPGDAQWSHAWSYRPESHGFA